MKLLMDPAAELSALGQQMNQFDVTAQLVFKEEVSSIRRLLLDQKTRCFLFKYVLS